MSSPEETNGRPVIRDLRRIDPATGQVRDSGQGGSAQPGSRGPSKPRGKHAASRPGGAAGMGAAAPAGPGARPGRPGADRADEAARSAADLQTAGQQLAERTADLQRVTAEYANYRKRVERDRAAVR